MTPAPAILTQAAYTLARSYPEFYTGPLPARVEWVGRVAEQLAYWADSYGKSGVIYGAPIVATWQYPDTRHGWAFAHQRARAIEAIPVDASGLLVAVRGFDWLAAAIASGGLGGTAAAS